MIMLRNSAIAALTLVAGTASADHVLGYTFNEAMGPAMADGGASAMGSPFLNYAGTAAVGAPGSGVSGFANDRAFDNTRAGVMGGVSSAGGRGQHAGDFQPIDTITSFTLGGWFKTDGTTPIGNNATLINNTASAVSGYGLAGTGATPGSLSLSVNNGSSSSGNVYGDTQSWVFFGVTYDGTAVQPGPNVFFYKGTVTDGVSLVASRTNIAGSVNDDTKALAIGGQNPFGSLNTFAFDGFIDNVRIWDSVLDAGALEAVRQADVVPAPGAAALIGLAGLSAARRRRN